MLAPVTGWMSKMGSCRLLEIVTPQPPLAPQEPTRLAAGREERALVGLQQFDPVADIPRMPEIAIKTELCAQERGA
jgi:hypothetical protein